MSGLLRQVSLPARVLLALVVLALIGPWLVPSDPDYSDLAQMLQAPMWLPGGSAAHPLGCDSLGRDVLARIIAGAQTSVFVGVVVTVLSTVFGAALGLFSGYLSPFVDAVLGRIADVLLAFPYLLFAIGIVAILGPGIQNVVVALALKEWVTAYRVCRVETLGIKKSEFVDAARSIGCADLRIMFGEILPNIARVLIAVGTLRMGHVIILESSLSFLGLGVQPPAVSWGGMIADGRMYLAEGWWVSIFPGIAILGFVIAVNLVAQEGVRGTSSVRPLAPAET